MKKQKIVTYGAIRMKTWEEMDRLGVILDAEWQLELEEKRKKQKKEDNKCSNQEKKLKE